MNPQAMVTDERRIDESMGGLAGRPAHRPGMTILTGALAVGIAIGWHQPQPWVWPWALAAGAALLAALVIQRRSSALLMMFLAGSVMAFGAVWVTIRLHYVSPNDLSAWIGEEKVLIRVRGEASRGPEFRHRTAGSMARFDYRKPVTYFPMRVHALISRDGSETPVRGNVLVRVDESVPPFYAGDRIEAKGFLARPGAPRNPGEFDFRLYARALGQAGFLMVPERELLTVTPAERSTLSSGFLNWRDSLRRRAGAWLLADLPVTDRCRRTALLSNLLLGVRDPQIDEMYESFQRVGLAHLLAISGFHLGVLAGFVLLTARLVGGHHRWHGWLIICVVLVYLTIVELRMPVLRAGVMTIAASLALVTGRRLRVSGLVALSAVLLLLWRPDQLFNPGFQLTYAVVLGLIHLVPHVRSRWFGRRTPDAATIGGMLGEWIRNAVIVAIVAWSVATPIAMYHFGMVAPLGAPLSVLAVPLSAVLLAIGYAKMLLAAVLPSAALLFGIPLSVGADVLLSIVEGFDSMPGSVLHVPYPSAEWTIAAVVWAWWWGIRPAGRGGRVVWISFVLLLALMIWPLVPLSPPPALRIDMLSVGDGSCFVIRSGGRTVVFDAGSSTDLDAGRSTFTPAMRRLGVRSVDAIIISHANLDHYSAVLELADEFDVNEVLVTPQFLSAAEDDLLGSAASMLEELIKRRIVVRSVSDGLTREFGHAHWTWLHPPADARFEKVNDASMVIRVETVGRRILLCGDIQNDAMERLLQRRDDLAADVVELPHHGSFHDRAVEFIDAVDPDVAMQSTGWWRWQRDRWAEKLGGTTRLITARDGACWVEIGDDGKIEIGRFLPPR